MLKLSKGEGGVYKQLKLEPFTDPIAQSDILGLEKKKSPFPTREFQILSDPWKITQLQLFFFFLNSLAIENR